MNVLRNKRIFITGVCGTVGAELVRQLLADTDSSPAEIIGIDNNESELFFLDQCYASDLRARFLVADVRDRSNLTRLLRGIDIVFHVAALKHVVLCERSPFEAVQTNIHGVQNIISAALENDVERVIFTSSDKAVNPTNVMGTSKLMGERLITAANSSERVGRTILASTRFGNVLGSRGSVLPIFQRQIENGGPITLTDENMTRFVMSLSDSVRLVIDSATLARGGEVFITKMPVIRIRDLAEVMIDVLAPVYGYRSPDIEIKEIGSKPGEKLYEELMNVEEIRRAVELRRYFSLLPAFRGLYKSIEYTYADMVNREVSNPYVSSEESPLSRSELRAFLETNNLLPVDTHHL